MFSFSPQRDSETTLCEVQNTVLHRNPDIKVERVDLGAKVIKLNTTSREQKRK